MKAALVGLTTLVCIPMFAAAHVAPAVTENNRYLTVSPLADRVRLSYTVFYGQVPGLEARVSMDTSGDSRISEDEKNDFAAKLGDEIAAVLIVTGDGEARPVHWQDLHVSIDDGRTDGGAFTVDLVAEICLDKTATEHVFTLKDGYQIAKPGEGELKLEVSPGIELVRSGIADGKDDRMDPKVTWQGQVGLVANPGYQLSYRLGEKAFTPDKPCTQHAAKASDTPSAPRWLFAISGAVLALLGGLTLLGLRRRNAKRPPS